MVESVPQLSPASHRHSKGRQLVSLLRRAEVLPAVLGLLRALSCDVFHLSTAEVASTTESAQASKAVLVDSLLVLGRLMDVAHSLVRADRSLGQGLSAEQQGQWVENIGTLLAHFQYALDGPPQALFPAQYTGRGALPALQLQKCDLEHTLRGALATLSLMCLQNGPMQKLCGATSPPGTGVSGGKKSLLAQICSWTPKYFKDKRCVSSCVGSLMFVLTRLNNTPSNYFQVQACDASVLDFSVPGLRRQRVATAASRQALHCIEVP